MEDYAFIDRFFNSSFELMDLRDTEIRDGNTLISFLNNLQTVNDRFKRAFEIDFNDYPEFKLLRLIRNYFQHEGDVQETRVFFTHQSVLLSHSEQVIIPICDLAKALRPLLNGKPQAWKKEEIAAILKFSPGLREVVDNLEGFTQDPQLLHKGQYYSGGYDLYIPIYNITNIVASRCRTVPELADKSIVAGLDRTYDIDNNIGNENMTVRLGMTPVLTTKGFIFL
ncbi:hypothetical protein [Citrobacter braakii]|uniref:hypothetical protein n=1 Tax=Citrobacter braakii TaxID=57706 RepID=UPI002DB6E021|nr:hypothetical protein [Citrobacter braakii]MEB8014815.1 hypothetical protein [Citrobacter braakii]